MTRPLESPPVRLTLVQAFRITALAEATSFVLLLVATYVKHAHDEPVGVQVLGPLHGLLFIAYGLLALNLAPRAGWSAMTTIWVLVAAVVPFGGFVVDRWLARTPPVLST